MNYFKAFAYLTFSVTPIMLLHFVRKKYKQLSNKKFVDNYKYKTMFSSANNRECKTHIFKRVSCKESCAFNHLQYIIQFIQTTKHSLNMCMYFLTSTEIQDALIGLHKKGVKVRFITDSVMVEHNSARIDYLKEAGIHIKVQPKTNDKLMHHKFCFADEGDSSRCKIFFGTLNLTVQAITRNWEAVVFTNNVHIIKRYQNEFERLWLVMNDY